jgi:hypothetical protein
MLFSLWLRISSPTISPISEGGFRCSSTVAGLQCFWKQLQAKSVSAAASQILVCQFHAWIYKYEVKESKTPR